MRVYGGIVRLAACKICVRRSGSRNAKTRTLPYGLDCRYRVRDGEVDQRRVRRQRKFRFPLRDDQGMAGLTNTHTLFVSLRPSASNAAQSAACVTYRFQFGYDLGQSEGVILRACTATSFWLAYCNSTAGAVVLERVEFFSRVCLVQVRGQSSQCWLLGAQSEACVSVWIASWVHIVREVDVLCTTVIRRLYGGPGLRTELTNSLTLNQDA